MTRPVIAQMIGEPAVLEQLAQEAAEVSVTALRLSRILRNENPTNYNMLDTKEQLIKELSDLAVCTEALGIGARHKTVERKAREWEEATRAACCPLLEV